MTQNSDISDLVGNTPLMRLSLLHDDESFELWGKAEFMNPGGSVKDRIAKYIIEQAEKTGVLRRDCTIVEGTSGNTGIALSMVAAAKGYKMLAVMPEHMSKERIKIMQNFGADICLTPKELSFKGAVDKAEEIARHNPKMFYTDQFHNAGNPEAHYYYTGREIGQQVGGNVDLFLAGVGTGGTVMGVGRALKELHTHIRIIAVEPEECAALYAAKTGNEARLGDHKIPGIGDGFVPEIVNMSEIHDAITVRSDDAIAMANKLNREYGLPVGISSGANVLATIKALKKYGKDKTAVTILPDRTERYFSTELYSEANLSTTLRECKRDKECPFTVQKPL